MAIYGLKQAPRDWYHELRQFLVAFSFKNSHVDISLFTLNTSSYTIYLLIYVDDIIIIRSSVNVVQSFVVLLAQRFSLKDFGSFTYFLGVEVVPHKHELLLSQYRYIEDLLAHTKMINAKSIATLLSTNLTLTLHYNYH